MDKQQTSRQLRIAFDAHSTLAQNLREGQFTVLLECRAPPANEPFKLALTPALDLARAVKTDRRIAGLVLSAEHGRETHSLSTTASELHAACDKEIIVQLANANSDRDQARQRLAALESAGVATVVAATGRGRPDHPRDKKGVPLPCPQSYLDSTILLSLIARHHPSVCGGALVNPFKYTVADAFLQYYKMVKKLNCGARFLVTQAGWDVRKLQELQWFMRSRDLDTPVLARLRLLRPRDVTALLEQPGSGLVISRELAAVLQRESAISEDQALGAQIERLALLAAGCRLIGYSGVILAGVDRPETAQALADRMFAVLTAHEQFAPWVAAWNDFQAQVELAPQPFRYYVFTQLLNQDFPDYGGNFTPMTKEQMTWPGRRERLAYHLAAALGLARRRYFPFGFLRRLLCHDRPGAVWHLGKTQLLAAAGCPKGLEEGACGGSRPDGTCEFGHGPCFYQRVLRRACWRNNLDSFETAVET